MNDQRPFSDEFLNAFVDNQLDPAEKSQAYAVINDDSDLNQRVCELRKMHDLVQLAYQNPPVPSPYRHEPTRGSRLRNGIAASLLLAIGIGLGWLLRYPAGLTGNEADRVEANAAPDRQSPSATPAGDGKLASAGEMRVLFHLHSGDTERMEEVLDEAESLLKIYRKQGQKARVEIVTNGDGINLLRADTSPFSDRVRAMRHRYKNLVFAACQNSIDRLKSEQGITAKLLPEAIVVDSGVAQIILRQQQGWTYIRV